MDIKRMKNIALFGLLGGILVAIGDLLVYMLPNVHNINGIYADWEKMSMWRPTASLYLGCLGSVLLLIGFFSLYGIVKEKCSHFIEYFCKFVAVGIALTSIGHFLIACIVPMTYKGAISAGASTEMAQIISTFWENYISPLKIFIMLVVILLQSIFMIILIIKGRIDCPKWMVILNPIGLIIISVPISILLNGTGFEHLLYSLLDFI